MRSRIVHHHRAFANLALLDAVDVALDGHLSLNRRFREDAERHGLRRVLAARARRRRLRVDLEGLEDAVARFAPDLLRVR